MGRAARLEKSYHFCNEFSNRKFKKYEGYKEPENIAYNLRKLLDGIHRTQREEALQYFGIFNSIKSAFILDKDPYLPVFAISSDLLQMLANTEIPSCLYNFPKVIQNCILVFPKNIVVDNKTGNSLEYLIVEDTTTDDLNNGRLHEFLKTRLFDKREIERINLLSYGDRIFSIDGSVSSAVSIDNEGRIHRGSNQNDNNFLNTIFDNDRTFCHKCMNVALSCILYLAAIEPKKIIKTTSLASKKEAHQQKQDIEETFRWLDLSEINKQEKEVRSPSKHASPITHWRRGHWRNQPCGEKLQESKIIWIQPTLINPTQE